jgi:DNA helicase-2/ATP-dependent DNA helicase PcrA
VGGDEPAEAAFVAREIERLLAERLVEDHGEIAVLYRTNQQAQELTVALRARSLPYRVRGNGDLFARPEVRDAVAYLRLAHNPADHAALARIMNRPPRRLGRLAELARTQPLALSDLPSIAARSGPAAGASAEKLANLIHELHQEGAGLGPAPLLDLVLERSGYRDWVNGLSDGPVRLAGLTALRTLADRSDGELGDWLAELHQGEEVEEAPAHHGRVLLTTIHGAKGAEWRVVFVVGVEEGLLPHTHALLASEPVDGSARQTVAAGLEEELRVAYVAVTRPRERLYLSWCRQRRRGDRVESRTPSRFLQALPAELLARAA